MLFLLACAGEPESKAPAETGEVDSACAEDADNDGACAEVDDCDDADPARYPLASETCDELDNNCDGSIDEGVTTAFYADADADAYGDLAVSVFACAAPTGFIADTTDCDDTNAEVNPTMEEVCNNTLDDNCDGGDYPCGSGPVELTTPMYEGLGQTGAGVAALGDGDGNGAVDVAVGSPFAMSVDVYTDGDFALSPVSTFTGDDASDKTGSVLVGPGDVNGDGHADLVIGAPYQDGASTNTGDAWVEFGPFTGGHTIGAGGDRLITWSAGENLLGSALSGGEFDGDGRSDVLVGAPGYTTGAGGAFLVPGPITSGIGGLKVSLTGDQVSDGVGTAVLGPVDTNGDGLGDVIAGAPGWDSAGAAHGGACIVRGPAAFSGKLADADACVTGDNQHGKSLAAADLDGDGYFELLVGGPNTVLVFSGPFVGTVGSSVATRVISSTTFELGGSMVIAGDVDADGTTDVALSGINENPAWVLRGPIPTGAIDLDSGSLPVDSRASVSAWNIGGTLAAPGDLDQDGYDDLVLGQQTFEHGVGGVFVVYGTGL